MCVAPDGNTLVDTSAKNFASFDLEGLKSETDSAKAQENLLLATPKVSLNQIIKD